MLCSRRRPGPIPTVNGVHQSSKSSYVGAGGDRIPPRTSDSPARAEQLHEVALTGPDPRPPHPEMAGSTSRTPAQKVRRDVMLPESPRSTQRSSRPARQRAPSHSLRHRDRSGSRSPGSTARRRTCRSRRAGSRRSPSRTSTPGVAQTARLDERRGRVDRGDGFRLPLASHQLPRQPTWPAADIEQSHVRFDPGSVGKGRRKRGEISAHQPVVVLGRCIEGVAQLRTDVSHGDRPPGGISVIVAPAPPAVASVFPPIVGTHIQSEVLRLDSVDGRPARRTLLARGRLRTRPTVTFPAPSRSRSRLPTSTSPSDSS